MKPNTIVAISDPVPEVPGMEKGILTISWIEGAYRGGLFLPLVNEDHDYYTNFDAFGVFYL